VFPFGRLWYGEPNAIGYAKFYSRSHNAVIRVYDEAGNGSRRTSTRAISKSGEDVGRPLQLSQSGLINERRFLRVRQGQNTSLSVHALRRKIWWKKCMLISTLGSAGLVAVAIPLVAIPLAVSVNEITAVRVGVIAIVVAISVSGTTVIRIFVTGRRVIRIGVRTGAIIAIIAGQIVLARG
jgi:hypothetical protein